MFSVIFKLDDLKMLFLLPVRNMLVKILNIYGFKFKSTRNMNDSILPKISHHWCNSEEIADENYLQIKANV